MILLTLVVLVAIVENASIDDDCGCCSCGCGCDRNAVTAVDDDCAVANHSVTRALPYRILLRN